MLLAGQYLLPARYGIILHPTWGKICGLKKRMTGLGAASLDTEGRILRLVYIRVASRAANGLRSCSCMFVRGFNTPAE